MAVRASRVLAAKAKVLMPGLVHELEKRVGQQPERILRRAGTLCIPQVCLPSRLQKAIRASLQEFPVRKIRDDAAKLSENLKARSRGWLEPLGNTNMEETIHSLLEEDIGAGRDSMKTSKLVESGQAVHYNTSATAAYVAMRMPCAYAAVLRVLQEVRERLPEFQPTSLLDFGTGPGTAVWAAHDVWPSSIQRLVGVEPAVSMMKFCSTLLQSLPEMPRMVSFPTLDSASKKLRGEDRIHDIVIAAYSLGELPGDQKEDIVRRLWSHTKDILVLIEPGTPKGWQTVLEGRQQVLGFEKRRERKKARASETNSNSLGGMEVGAHVVAPCSHDGSCPMEGTSSWCHFKQRLQRSEVHRLAKKAVGGIIRYNHEDEKFAFVVLKRGSRQVLPSPLEKLPELWQRSKDGKTLKKEAFDKQAVYMRHLLSSLRRDAEICIPGAVRTTSNVVENASSDLKKGHENNLTDHQNRVSCSTSDSEDSSSKTLAEDCDTDREDGDLDSDEENLQEEEPEEIMVAEVNSSWARIVRPPRRRGAHVIIDMCCSTDEEGMSGELQRHILTHKSPKMEYRFARNSAWGDLWPMPGTKNKC